MDWKYKHFNQEAIYSASPEEVLAAARSIVAGALESIEDTADSFVARGYSGFHAAVATIHITPEPAGTKVAVELLVKRSFLGSYMLFDIGGYYNGQIDKWFQGIAQRLNSANEQVLVRKTTANFRIRQGCLVGCLVYLVVGVALVILVLALSSVLFPQSAGTLQEPLSMAASSIGLFAGVAAYLYVVYPDAPVFKHLRERLQRTQNKDKP